MLHTNLPLAIRRLRRRRGWRQADVAAAAGVSRQVISRIERGEALGSVPLRTITRLIEALDASMQVTERWHGEELDRNGQKWALMPGGRESGRFAADRSP